MIKVTVRPALALFDTRLTIKLNRPVREETIYPAQIFGVDKLVGSIEVGKMANLIVTDGDPLEFKTNVKHMFINGKPVDLSSRHTRLYDKFKDRP